MKCLLSRDPSSPVCLGLEHIPSPAGFNNLHLLFERLLVEGRPLTLGSNLSLTFMSIFGQSLFALTHPLTFKHSHTRTLPWMPWMRTAEGLSFIILLRSVSSLCRLGVWFLPHVAFLRLATCGCRDTVTNINLLHALKYN